MKRKLLDALRDERGYVMVLALIAMPLLLGFSLLVIDVGRGNNLHTDLQNAVDALALAGARELDGGSDSIDRAEAAMTDLIKNQARFSNGGSVIVDADEVTWHFLATKPASDDTEIDLDVHETDEPTLAAFVWVISNQRPMTSLFPLPVGLTLDTVNFQASAVATYDVSACDVTPLFICNPFEVVGENISFEDKFSEGAVYSRQMTLSFNGGTSIGPGNFGWLQVADPGGSALRDALATGKPGVCYSQGGLTTKTGGTIGPAEQGLNTRFGIYAGAMRDNDPATPPATNVRRGERRPTNNSSCGAYEEETDPTRAMAFPAVSLPNQGIYGNQTLQGGTMSGEVWDYIRYWEVNHPGVSRPIPFPTPSDPTGERTVPSRYDVYLYELANNLIIGTANTAPNGETGDPNRCYRGPAGSIRPQPDRRLIFAAVIDCRATPFNGQTTFTRPAAFVSMFLTKPMIASGGTKTVSVEVVDVTGYSGNGTLETFLREESTLVR